ncbi:MAG: 50S ribosomal protein L11 [Bdellovibrionales bacterium]
MAKKVTGQIKLQIPAGRRIQRLRVDRRSDNMVNIMDFCKQFNAKTQQMGDTIIPVIITVYQDRSFSFITKTPPTSVLIKQTLKLKSGSKMPQKDKVGKISVEQIKEIAETKIPDLNCLQVESAMSQVAGTAKSMGLQVPKEYGV